MRVSLNWLNEFLDIKGLSPKEIADKLVFSGTEVESVLEVGEFADEYIVVEVIEVSRREGIRLPVCTIYDGRSKYEVVTGAENIRKGKFLWCPPGARVKVKDEKIQIGVKKIKNVVSYGMLLSPAEIGFPDSEEMKLFELPDYVEVGVRASRILNLPDHVLDISVTPQRGDLLSVLGVAIELAAITGAQLKFNTETIWSLENSLRELKELISDFSETPQIHIEEPQRCKLYFGGVFSGSIVNRASQPHIISRLYVCGSRPINPIVDATNYVLFEIGQPTHAFDYDKIKRADGTPGRIVVRNSRKGEKILCLDGKERELSDDHLVIADDLRPIAVAGVIGGEETAVSWNTKNILLESAFFTPTHVRRTSKSLGIETESSYRFSRRVNPAGVLLAVLRIADILKKEGFELSCANFVGDVREFQNKKVIVPISFFSDYVGCHIEQNEVVGTLERLGIKTSGHDEHLICNIPIWRGDLNIKEDLVEEVIRILGYDRIPSTIPKFPASYDEKQEDVEIRDRVERIRDLMANIGYCEVKTYPFSRNEGLRIVNPISADFAFFSENLEDRIYETVLDSVKKGLRSVRVFEIERDFSGNWILAFGACGYSFPQKWSFPRDKKMDVFDIKEVFELIIPSLRFSSERVQQNQYVTEVFSGGMKVGTIAVRRSYELSDDIFLGKVYINMIPDIRVEPGRFHSELPLIERDVSFFVRENTRWSDIKELFFVSESVVDAFIFDIWEKEGRRSFTVRIVINQGNRTMTSEEINRILQKIIESLGKAGFEVRAV